MKNKIRVLAALPTGVRQQRFSIPKKMLISRFNLQFISVFLSYSVRVLLLIMYFVLCLQQNREKIREEFRASFNSVGRKNSLAGQYSEVCFSVWLGFTCTMLRMLHNRSIFLFLFAFVSFTNDSVPSLSQMIRTRRNCCVSPCL